MRLTLAPIIFASLLGLTAGCARSLDIDAPIGAADVCEDCDVSEVSCSDGVLNGDEEGVDCGGSCPEACDTCMLGMTCSDQSDCVSPLSCVDGCCEAYDEACEPVGVACSDEGDCATLGSDFQCTDGCCTLTMDECGEATACRTNAACGVNAFCDAGCCRDGGPGAPCEGAAADGTDLTAAGECNRDFSAVDYCDALGVVVRTICEGAAYCAVIEDLAQCVTSPGTTCRAGDELLHCMGTDAACVEIAWDGLVDYTCLEHVEACEGTSSTRSCTSIDLGDEPLDVLITECRDGQPIGTDCDLYGGLCAGNACLVSAGSACDGRLIVCETGECSGMVLDADSGEVLVWGQCPEL